MYILLDKAPKENPTFQQKLELIQAFFTKYSFNSETKKVERGIDISFNSLAMKDMRYYFCRAYQSRTKEIIELKMFSGDYNKIIDYIYNSVVQNYILHKEYLRNLDYYDPPYRFIDHTKGKNNFWIRANYSVKDAFRYSPMGDLFRKAPVEFKYGLWRQRTWTESYKSKTYKVIYSTHQKLEFFDYNSEGDPIFKLIKIRQKTKGNRKLNVHHSYVHETKKGTLSREKFDWRNYEYEN